MNEHTCACGKTTGCCKTKKIKHTIAVSSGKGGVGKSTVSINFAIALQNMGYSVGILDADVTAPNIPFMLGISDAKPEISQDMTEFSLRPRLIPVQYNGIKVISMALFAKAEEPIVLRGPMQHKVINQFVNDIEWGQLDYLVVDLPPGTGDAQISISQIMQPSGAIVVSTPQPVAALDTKKAIQMFQQSGIHVYGIVENMSYFVAPDTGHRYNVFGETAIPALAAECNLPVLCQLPIQTDMIIASGEVAASFSRLADRIANSHACHSH